MEVEKGSDWPALYDVRPLVRVLHREVTEPCARAGMLTDDPMTIGRLCVFLEFCALAKISSDEELHRSYLHATEFFQLEDAVVWPEVARLSPDEASP